MQTLPNTGERQVATSLKQVAPDHKARYYWVGKQLPRRARVTDIGSGCGYGAYILAMSGLEVHGYDVDFDAVEYARENWHHYRASFWLGDASHPESITDWGSYAVAFEVIEHLSDPVPVLQAVAAPVLFLSVPDQSGNPWSKEKFPFHCRHYTMREIEDLLHSTGWSVKERWCQYTKSPGYLVPYEGDPARTLVIKAERKA
jgi:2-polyprenyl-3-methyl-5-hydroxy-6-metoxy-1,4-benzoquinol methylase